MMGRDYAFESDIYSGPFSGRLTALYAGRDLKRPEDVDSSGADHALDAMRHGVHRIEWAKDIKVQWNRW